MNKRKMFRKTAAVLSAAALAAGLAACGGTTDSTGSSADPNHYEVGDFALDYKGARIMTDSNEKDALVITLDFTNNSDDAESFLWAISDSATQNGTELEYAYVFTSAGSYDMLSDSEETEVESGETIEVEPCFELADTENTVTVKFEEIFGDENVEIEIDPSTLSRDDSNLAAADSAGESEAESQSAEAAAESETESQSGEETDPLLAWWNGDWYGWWIVDGATGSYEEMDGMWFDTCAVIDIGSGYTGTVLLWDEEDSPEAPTGEAEVSLSGYGTGEHGTLFSEGGYFLDDELEHADWISDPAVDAEGIDNMILFSGTAEFDDGYYNYAVYLRPWGVYWDDLEEDARPYYYSSWYVPLIDSGTSMPDTIGEGADAAGEEAVKEGEAAEKEETAEASENEETGTSAGSGSGVTTRDTLVGVYNRLWDWDSAAEGKSKFELTYEELVSMIGVEGDPQTDREWSDESHMYCWYGEGTNVILSITFKDAGSGAGLTLNNYALTGDY